MKVLFVAQYGPLAASSRTRVFDYLPFLRTANVRADVMVVTPDVLVALLNAGGLFNRLRYYVQSWWRTWRVGWRCLWRARRYDAVFVQKVLFPEPIPELLRRFYRRKLIFDFDDAIFTLEAPSESWLNRLRTRRRQRGLPAMLRAARCAVVENAYTADYAAQFGADVVRITGPIDTERYSPGSEHDADEVVLGWIGSPTTTRYLELIREPLAEIGRRFDYVRLCLIGASDFALGDLTVTRCNWTLETEVEHLRAFDIGLMPLPGDPFTRGKGGYKLLQFLAMGIPVVASPVEINREIVDDGQNGFLAATDAEWVAHLSRLIDDADLRRRLGLHGRRKMEDQYSLKKSSQRLLHLLQSLAQN